MDGIVRGDDFPEIVLGEAFGELVDPLLRKLGRNVFHPCVGLRVRRGLLGCEYTRLGRRLVGELEARMVCTAKRHA